MGLFDSFRKKVEKKSEEINPLYTYLKDADLGIHNLQVVDQNGIVTVTGEVQEGQSMERVNELLAAKNIASLNNNITVADLSDLGIRYTVNTNSSNLNCRKGPSTDQDIVGKFPKGAVVNLVQRHNATWHKVRNEEIEGYCHTDYLSQVQNT